MQYKIPVQIENEDPIFLWLSLRQLSIMMIWWWIAYSIFNSLIQVFPTEVALIPSGIVAVFAFLIAVFKHSEMTFIPFILSLIRFHTNPKQRTWTQWVDSFQPIDVGYVTYTQQDNNKKIDLSGKAKKLEELQKNINKL